MLVSQRCRRTSSRGNAPAVPFRGAVGNAGSRAPVWRPPPLESRRPQGRYQVATTCPFFEHATYRNEREPSRGQGRGNTERKVRGDTSTTSLGGRAAVPQGSERFAPWCEGRDRAVTFANLPATVVLGADGPGGSVRRSHSEARRHPLVRRPSRVCATHKGRLRHPPATPLTGSSENTQV
jgi:hypothetical protein